MFLTEDQRKQIFEDGSEAAANRLNRSCCPYSADRSPERRYIWMGSYDEYLTEEAFRSGAGIRS